MKSWLRFATLATSLVALLTPGVVRGEVVTDPARVCILAKQGDGAWLDRPGLQKCLEASTSVASYQDEIVALDKLKESLQGSLDAQKGINAELHAVAVDLTTSNKQLTSELRAWYRNPAVTFVLGAATAFAVVIVVK